MSDLPLETLDTPPAHLGVAGTPPALVAQALGVSVSVPSPGAGRRPPCLVPKMQRRILDNVDIAFPHGSITALLGASGAGKTTLLNALCGRANGEVSGSVFRDPSRPGFTFIIQDDIMPQTLTPREILWYTAELMLPGTYTAAQKHRRVEELIDAFYLRACANTIVGIPGEKRGISGGERKRVSIAMSIVANPHLIFVDEPTSGLDSSAAFNVMKILANLAKEGRTVVCCIHQPSQEIYKLFSHVCLLAKGKIMYFGPKSSLKAHFASLGCQQPSHTTTAEWLIDMVDTNREKLEIGEASPKLSVVVDGAASSTVTPLDTQKEDSQKKARHRHKHGSSAQDELDITQPPAHTVEFLEFLSGGFGKSQLAAEIKRGIEDKTGLVKSSSIKVEYARALPMQVGVLVKRNMHALLRDKQFIMTRFMQTILVAALVAILFKRQPHNQTGVRNRLGFMFFSCMIMLLFSMLSVLFVLPQDFAVFLREYLNGTYRAIAYLPARFISDTPLQVVLPVVFASILYWSVGLNTDSGHIALFYGVMVLVANVGSSVGFLISAIARSITKSLQITPAIFMPNVMFAGFVLNLQSITPVLRWIQWVSFLKYAFAVLVKNEFTGSNGDDGSFYCASGETVATGQCPFTSGKAVLTYYGFEGTNTTGYCLALLGFIIGFRILATIIVVARMRSFVHRK